MKVLYEVLLEATQIFIAHGIVNAKRQTEEMLSDLLNCSLSHLYQNKNYCLSEKEKKIFDSWIERRLQGEPLAYLSGKIEFYGCTFKVNSDVLIPRPETEILVDKIVQYFKRQGIQKKIVWDVCCGSGCIGIALKKTFPHLTIYLSDLSEKALALASYNAAYHEVEVTFLKGDLLHPFEGKKADYVICNPPYISEDEYLNLDPGVKNYEPKEALLAGKSGLEFYERLAKELPSHLYPHAKVWLEIGYWQGESVKKLFQTYPWKNQQLENDWAGHNRFFFLEIE